MDAGFTQEQIDRYKNVMASDRGLGTPTPSPATYTPPPASSGPFSGNLIPTELQDIIRQVSSYNTPKSARAGLANVASNWLQGIYSNRATETGHGMTAASDLNKENAATSRTGMQIASNEKMAEEERKAKEKLSVPASTFSGGAGTTGSSGTAGVSTPPTTISMNESETLENKWLRQHPQAFWDNHPELLA